MLQSSGYFKNINCPYYSSGFCERPHCHFKHVKREDVTSTPQIDVPTTVDSKADLLKIYSETLRKIQEAEKELASSATQIQASSVLTYIPTPKHVAPRRNSVESHIPAMCMPAYRPTPIAQLRRMHKDSPFGDSVEFMPSLPASKRKAEDMYSDYPYQPQGKVSKRVEEYDPTKVTLSDGCKYSSTYSKTSLSSEDEADNQPDVHFSESSDDNGPKDEISGVPLRTDNMVANKGSDKFDVVTQILQESKVSENFIKSWTASAQSNTKSEVKTTAASKTIVLSSKKTEENTKLESGRVSSAVKEGKAERKKIGVNSVQMKDKKIDGAIQKKNLDSTKERNPSITKKKKQRVNSESVKGRKIVEVTNKSVAPSINNKDDNSENPVDRNHKRLKTDFVESSIDKGEKLVQKHEKSEQKDSISKKTLDVVKDKKSKYKTNNGKVDESSTSESSNSDCKIVNHYSKNKNKSEKIDKSNTNHKSKNSGSVTNHKHKNSHKIISLNIESSSSKISKLTEVVNDKTLSETNNNSKLEEDLKSESECNKNCENTFEKNSEFLYSERNSEADCNSDTNNKFDQLANHNFELKLQSEITIQSAPSSDPKLDIPNDKSIQSGSKSEKSSGNTSKSSSSKSPKKSSSSQSSRKSSSNKSSSKKSSSDKSKKSSPYKSSNKTSSSSSKDKLSSEHSTSKSSSSKSSSSKSSLKPSHKSSSRNSSHHSVKSSHRTSSSKSSKHSKSSSKSPDKKSSKTSSKDKNRNGNESSNAVSNGNPVQTNHTNEDAIAEDLIWFEDIEAGLDDHDELEECWRIFNEEAPTIISQPEMIGQKPKSVRQQHESQTSDTSADLLGCRRRVAHNPTGQFNTFECFGGSLKGTSASTIHSTPPAPPPPKPARKVFSSPAQAMANRFIRLQETYKRQTEQAANKSPPTAFAGLLPKQRSDQRIAHVPNAMRLAAMSPPRRNSQSNTNYSMAGPNVTVASTLTKGEKRVAHLPMATLSKRPIVPASYGNKIPVNVRQRYLNLFIDECLKFSHTEEAAFERGLQEEAEAYDRSSNKNVYLNVVVNLLKRLRTEAEAGPPPLPPPDPDEVIIIEDEVQKPAPPPPLAQKRLTSHQAMLGGSRAAKTSFSIERNRPKPAKEEILKGSVLYKLLTKYLLTPEQLMEGGFPQCNPAAPGKALISGLDIKKTYGNDSLHRQCTRCKSFYLVDDKGLHIRQEECVYHWGRIWKKRIAGSIESRYSCCEGDAESEGCSVGEGHVVENFDPEKVTGFVKTLEKPTFDGIHGVYALDCEMCYTTQGMELTRVTVVGDNLQPIYETMVKPENPVLDHNTRFSGITREDLEGVNTNLRDVQAVLLSLFSQKTILIGHSLESDFKALRLIHNTVVDTSMVFPHRRGLPFKRALRTLMGEHLNKIIQNSDGGHDSQEDAVACLELMIWKIKDDIKCSR